MQKASLDIFQRKLFMVLVNARVVQTKAYAQNLIKVELYKEQRCLQILEMNLLKTLPPLKELN